MDTLAVQEANQRIDLVHRVVGKRVGEHVDVNMLQRDNKGEGSTSEEGGKQRVKTEITWLT